VFLKMKVEHWTMGVVMAPYSLYRISPACTARVENPWLFFFGIRLLRWKECKNVLLDIKK
jgi:hypothetical protein